MYNVLIDRDGEGAPDYEQHQALDARLVEGSEPEYDDDLHS